jgi:hypothetical protein
MYRERSWPLDPMTAVVSARRTVTAAGNNT